MPHPFAGNRSADPRLVQHKGVEALVESFVLSQRGVKVYQGLRMRMLEE